MNARNLERKLGRMIEKTKMFFTVKGNKNEVVEQTQKELFFQTEKSSKANKIKRAAIRTAINYFSDAKTITRKECEKFTAFSSALFALLKLIFKDIVKLHVTASGAVRLTLKGVRYVFAGVDRSVRDFEAAANNGAKFFLMSYYFIRSRKAWKEHVERLGVKLIVDSGAFSAWNKGEVIDVKEYAAFIKEHSEVIHSFFTLDVIGDAAATAANTEYLRQCGLNPIPVYHVQSDLNELQKIVNEGHAVVGIGGAAKMSKTERIEKVKNIFAAFPGENFHFLGCGDAEILRGFDWFSADATTWISSRKYNVVTNEKGQQKAPELTAMECLERTVKFFASLEVAI